MDIDAILADERGLDPADWEATRRLGHQMLDDMIDYLSTVRERPVWQAVTKEAKEHLDRELPLQPLSAEAVYENFKTHILPFPKGNIHPRFWSWVEGGGTPLGVLAELLAAAMNPNVSIGDHAAMYVDGQVIEWCKTMMGFPDNAGGILLSGGTMANITAIQVARNSFADADIRREGVGAAGAPLTVYASSETHSCIHKAVEIAGLGRNHLRLIPVDEQYQIDLTMLQQQIDADRAAGMLPFCLIANAGTVNTGAIDPLDELHRICQQESLWFHVDGAFGALAKLVPELSAELQAIEKADSVAFDLHKWMYLPYEVGCVLIRDVQLQRAAFAYQPDYLLSHERGLAAGPDPISNYGMELSRGFKSLKVWMCLQQYGLPAFARQIRQNIAQARYLADLIDAAPELERLAAVPMNIVCFRYRTKEMDEATLNMFNKELLMRLHESGIAAPSYTLLRGRYAMRVANTNHRSRKSDFDILVDTVRRIGAGLAREWSAQTSG